MEGFYASSFALEALEESPLLSREVAGKAWGVTAIDIIQVSPVTRAVSIAGVHAVMPSILAEGVFAKMRPAHLVDRPHCLLLDAVC